MTVIFPGMRAKAPAKGASRNFANVSTGRRILKRKTTALLFCSTAGRFPSPGRRKVILPHAALAELVTAEWAGQGVLIDPSAMPITCICNSAIEGVAGEMLAVTGEIVRYAGSDLVCYRASEPASLAAAQAQAWDPVLDWARAALGADFQPALGVVHLAQPPAAISAARSALERCTGTGAAAPFRLAALSVITSLTGSALLALQCAMGAATPEGAWGASHVDEDFQARMWGSDDEAQARRLSRWLEMRAAGQVLISCPAVTDV